jgi:hypothetical protein
MPTVGEVLVGIGTGLIQTFIFNPVDRALYLHIKDNTSFLAKSNWINPYHGVFNALGNRVIQYGFYYNIVDYYSDAIKAHHWLPEQFHSIGAGVATGITTAVLLNPVSCVKYHAWGTDHKLSYVARDMYKTSGVISFTRGLGTTAIRDSAFSSMYLLGKRSVESNCTDPTLRFFGNIFISCVATVITSPINYIRNIKYASGYVRSNPSYDHIMTLLLKDQVPYSSNSGALPVIKYYFRKFAIGWGTLRVGVGIACGQSVYDYLMASYVLQHKPRAAE